MELVAVNNVSELRVSVYALQQKNYNLQHGQKVDIDMNPFHSKHDSKHKDTRVLIGICHDIATPTDAKHLLNCIKISSRSHCIFTLHVNQYKAGDVTASKINLIDLADSERVNKDGRGGAAHG